MRNETKYRKQGGPGIAFLPGNGRAVTGNLGTVDSGSRTPEPVGVLDVVLFLDCTGRKWGQCASLSLSQTIT